MRALWLFLFLPFLVQAQSYRITYDITVARDSFYILGHHLAEQRLIYDTLYAKEGEALSFSSQNMAPGLYFLYGPGRGFYQEFIVNEPAIKITTDGTYQGSIVEDSKENELFFQFQKVSLPLQQQKARYFDSLKAAPEDSLKITQEIEELDAEVAALIQTLTSASPSLLASKMLRLLQPVIAAYVEEKSSKAKYDAYQKLYYDRLDFSETGLIRTPVFKRNVMTYLTQVAPQAPDSIIVILDEILNTVAADTSAFQYWLSTFSLHYEKSNKMGRQAILVHLFDTYYLSGKAPWLKDETRARMAQEVALMRPNQIGKPAPELKLLDTSLVFSRPLALPTPYLVLYFYDPDCGVCKKNTPLLKADYEALKAANTEVVAINIASEASKWRAYIRENKLSWVNLADLNYQSDFREKYNIKSVPFLYILDSKRKIIARGLSVSQALDFITHHQNATSTSR